MRPLFIAAALAIAPLAAVVAGGPVAAAAAEPTPKDAGGVTIAQLRTIVEGLGYSTSDGKDPALPEFEFLINAGGLDIYILAQQSESTNYIWLKLSFDKLKPGQDGVTFLEQTVRAQPAHFFLYDDGTLGMAVTVENRSITPAIVQRGIDILVEGAVTTKDSWLTD